MDNSLSTKFKKVLKLKIFSDQFENPIKSVFHFLAFKVKITCALFTGMIFEQQKQARPSGGFINSYSQTTTL